jgi:hypothetical protein
MRALGAELFHRGRSADLSAAAVMATRVPARHDLRHSLIHRCRFLAALHGLWPFVFGRLALSHHSLRKIRTGGFRMGHRTTIRRHGRNEPSMANRKSRRGSSILVDIRRVRDRADTVASCISCATQTRARTMSAVRIRSPRHTRPMPGMRSRAEGNEGDDMKRRLFNILSAVSLLLCVGSCLLWVRSYWQLDEAIVAHWNALHSPATRIRAGVVSHWGRAEIYFVVEGVPLHRGGTSRTVADRYWYWMYDSPMNPVPQAERIPAGPFGFHWTFQANKLRGHWGHWGHVAAPYWFVVLLAAFMPVRWFGRWRRGRYRLAHNLCSDCGYDLRTMPDRCPECGAVPLAKATA